MMYISIFFWKLMFTVFWFCKFRLQWTIEKQLAKSCTLLHALLTMFVIKGQLETNYLILRVMLHTFKPQTNLDGSK